MLFSLPETVYGKNRPILPNEHIQAYFTKESDPPNSSMQLRRLVFEEDIFDKLMSLQLNTPRTQKLHHENMYKIYHHFADNDPGVVLDKVNSHIGVLLEPVSDAVWPIQDWPENLRKGRYINEKIESMITNLRSSDNQSRNALVHILHWWRFEAITCFPAIIDSGLPLGGNSTSRVPSDV